MVRGLLDQEEDTMKLISRFEAAALGTAQLYGLRKDAFVALCAASHGSKAARDALCNMRTIENELAARAPVP